jgi:hypothetical protein
MWLHQTYQLVIELKVKEGKTVQPQTIPGGWYTETQHSNLNIRQMKTVERIFLSNLNQRGILGHVLSNRSTNKKLLIICS